MNAGVSSSSICVNKYRGSINYVNHTKLTNPGYLYDLYHTAVNIKGPKAGFQELACIMNSRTLVPSETRIDLSLNRLQVNN